MIDVIILGFSWSKMIGYLSPILKHMYINVCACLVSIVADILMWTTMILAESGTEPVFYLCLENKPFIIYQMAKWRHI